MTKWTKAEIDELFDAIERSQGIIKGIGPARDIYVQRRDVYLAAGLTAEGAPATPGQMTEEDWVRAIAAAEAENIDRTILTRERLGGTEPPMPTKAQIDRLIAALPRDEYGPDVPHLHLDGDWQRVLYRAAGIEVSE